MLRSVYESNGTTLFGPEKPEFFIDLCVIARDFGLQELFAEAIKSLRVALDWEEDELKLISHLDRMRTVDEVQVRALADEVEIDRMPQLLTNAEVLPKLSVEIIGKWLDSVDIITKKGVAVDETVQGGGRPSKVPRLS
jgi:hypothetical protein